MIFHALLGLLLVFVALFGGMIAAGALAKYVGPDVAVYGVIVSIVAVAILFFKTK